jgi:hypothetical protein
MENTLKIAKALLVSFSILQSSLGAALPSTTAKNWVYKTFEADSTERVFTSGAEGGFLLNPAPEQISTTVFVFKKTLPQSWKASQDLRQWKILLATFNETNEKRSIMKDSVIKNAKSSELSYIFEMNYMPVENIVHHSLGVIKIKGDSAYLIVYDRRSTEYQSDLAAAKELLQSVQVN